MTLHARSVATAAGTHDDIFDTVVEGLIESGEIKVWKAQQLVSEIHAQAALSKDGEVSEGSSTRSAGYGKIILLGEHAVVFQ